MGKGTRLVGIMAALLLGAACNKAQVAAPLADSGMTYVPGVAWRTADPRAAGLDAERLGVLRADIPGGRYGAVDAVIVVRYGHLVHEQYVGWQANRSHTLQSVTKSVTALLYGILSERADANLDRRVVDVFARYAPIANRDANKDSLRLRHLLTMRAAMDYWEQPYPGSPHDSLNRSDGDWTRFILDRRMTGAPGSAWAYNSGAAILACSAIREILNEPVPTFARRELFEPIGVTSDAWIRSPYDQLPHCGGGLNLTPSDLARIGYLVLRKGKWGDRQVVPAAWIETMAQPVTAGSPLFFSTNGSKYGYFWWLFPTTRGGSDAGVIAGSGSGGQWLFIVPSKDLVIAMAASNGRGLDLLYDVLDAVR